MKKDRPVDPLQAWRRKEKVKASKARKRAREERVSDIPAHRRDPAPLIAEIYRLSVLDYEGKLNSDVKQHRKRLLDQFHSIKKARMAAGLETVELVEFDPEAHEAAKLKQFHQSKPPKQQSQLPELQRNYPPSLPELPSEPIPTDEELAAFGLPPYAVDSLDMQAQLENEYDLFMESLQDDEDQ
jgi:hypothetical protein